jgi:SAM-dependent methyltransferase
MFDVMTDWQARLAGEAPFLRATLAEAGARSVLDAACGSGGHALALAGWGFAASGADPSPVMIELARQKTRAAGLEIPFAVAGFTELATHLPGPFDAVLCLGNSLPHLLTQEELVAGLRGMAAVLRAGGFLVTQNLNYDLRWRKQPRWFAAQGGELDGAEVVVWRFADYLPEEGRIAFHVALFRKGASGWQVEVHATPHRPLFATDLLAGLVDAGFVAPRAYSRLALPAEQFDPAQSGDCVIVARKA